MIKAAVIIFMAAVASAAAIAGPDPAAFLGPAFTDPAAETATDKLLFIVSMDVFLQAKAAKDPPYLIWDDSGCTFSPDKPLGFNFLDSCKRHDFGYRNYKQQDRFTEPNRKRIDDNFKKDLYNECSKYGVPGSWECRGLANVYYQAVRMFGRLPWPQASRGDVTLEIGEEGTYRLGPVREGWSGSWQRGGRGLRA